MLKAQQILWFAGVSFWEVFCQVDMKEKKGTLFLGMLVSARCVFSCVPVGLNLGLQYIQSYNLVMGAYSPANGAIICNYSNPTINLRVTFSGPASGQRTNCKSPVTTGRCCLPSMCWRGSWLNYPNFWCQSSRVLKKIPPNLECIEKDSKTSRKVQVKSALQWLFTKSTLRELRHLLSLLFWCL